MKNVLGSKRKFRFEAEDTMKFRLVFATAALLFAALLVTTPAAQASCTAATLTGGYGFSTSGGGSQTSSSRFLPNAFVGLAVFNGAGNWAASFTASDNGAISQGTLSGTYAVSSNCTGSFSTSSGDLNFNFVVVNGGKEILAIETDSGRTLTVDFLKQ